ncbi:restriction endonuclease subunit S [Kroppenstedtia guangzhouensis]|uniref:Restriction endonuclease subunit S n=1 Tax=Kroppenstedtia guangzhouensis TaxID=1274356 RepID=A0ABQ1GR73_9BACL|nr:restriction endonuclease subunit S [Kroppenstedtia guangzhouensis]GGA48466.1 restriction endonuclease subunit S [Kroppenstedtia guangzhouensis]
MYKTRHQEFINNLPTDWDIVSLNSIGEIRSGGTPSRDKEDFWNGKIPWVTPSELTSLKTKYLLSTQENITEKGLRSSAAKLLPIGSLLVTTRATIGNVAIASMSVSTNQGFKNIVPGKEIDSTFYYYLLGKISFEMKRLATGTTFDEISRRDFEAILVPKPSLSEQRRIAEILDTLDETIRKTEALIGKLKQVKMGLLHDLLTRGIDEQGQLRNPATHPEQFKDSPLGRIPREWGVSVLEDIAEVIMGQSPPGHSYNQKEIGIPLINGPVEFGFRYPRKLQWTTKPTKVCKYGDILFCVRGSTTGRINISNDEYCIGRGVAAIRGKEGISLTGFVEHFLVRLAEEILSEAKGNGSTFPSVNSKRLSSTLVMKPSLKEQGKILSIIESHNRRIQKEQSYLNKLQQLKKGLMEDLLTGKVRVNELEEVQA